MSTWTDLRERLDALFSRARTYLLDFVTPALHLMEQNGGKILTDAATLAVEAAELTSGGAEAKFAAAVASVSATLISEGVPLVKNAVHVAVESAVAKLNASTPGAA